ncbi:MAG: hypothetical protein JW804_01805 [Sedimentisphaerales bacterium]|nr:hypothetical protein [Sedimentisphaerales bacterium]
MAVRRDEPVCTSLDTSLEASFFDVFQFVHYCYAVCTKAVIFHFYLLFKDNPPYRERQAPPTGDGANRVVVSQRRIKIGFVFLQIPLFGKILALNWVRLGSFFFEILVFELKTRGIGFVLHKKGIADYADSSDFVD